MNKTSNYARINKKVIINNALSSKAKCLYCYLRCYSQDNNTVEIPRSLMCKELNMGNNTLSKYLYELRDNGFIMWETRKENGRILPNLYSFLQ